jgi:hypothetical protein
MHRSRHTIRTALPNLDNSRNAAARLCHRSGLHSSRRRVTSAHPPKMTAAQPATEMASTAAASACKRIGRNASASHRHGGNDDRGSVQHKFLHGSFLSVEMTSVIAPQSASARSIDFVTDIYSLPLGSALA